MRDEPVREETADPRGQDEGSAVVEFLAGTVLLLVPVVYLTLTLGQLQAATFAVHTAAREAARAATTATDAEVAAARADAAVALALSDQGVDAATRLTLTCSADPCLPAAVGASADPVTLRAEVTADVPLPGVPAFLDGALPLHVPVSARVVAPLDPFRAGP